MLWHRQTFFFVLIFLFSHALSFFLSQHLFAQHIVAFSIFMVFGVICYRNITYGWLFLITEYVLGSSGHLVELQGISLRLLLTITFVGIWYSRTIASGDIKRYIKELAPLSYLLLLFLCYTLLSLFLGIYYQHPFLFTIQDAIPFFFLFLCFPATHFLTQRQNYPYYIRLISVFFITMFLFSLFTFFLFSSGISELQDPYYKWFRDVIGGKITNLGYGFFRIVTPSHLMILPLLFPFVATHIHGAYSRYSKTLWLLISLAMFTLALNLSRTYLIGLVIGCVILLYKASLLRWIKTTFMLFFLFFSSFFLIHFIASGGSSLGLHVLGIRFQSVVTPSIEESAATRSTLLAPIFEKIYDHPFFGNGLGSTITFLHPTSYSYIETNQYDWGYFELLSEFGLFGFIIFSLLLLLVLFQLIRIIRLHHITSGIPIGLLASFIALLSMAVITPIFSHVFGIVFLVLMVGIAQTYRRNCII